MNKTPAWLDDALAQISQIDGVESIPHDSGPDYQVYITNSASKSEVMTEVESIYGSDFMITVSPTNKPDWFFVAIRNA